MDCESIVTGLTAGQNVSITPEKGLDRYFESVSRGEPDPTIYIVYKVEGNLTEALSINTVI